MIIVGLTGGIGSGKTTVAKQFNALNIPIYIADDEAKSLMNRSKVIKRKLIKLFGIKAYVDGKLNRPFLANAIFNDKNKLQAMNAIVHPKVAKHFDRWLKKQNTPYIIKEVAILFENESDKHCDLVITVTAPKNLRMQRLLERDKTTKVKIQNIMDNQWSDKAKVERSDFVIINDTLKATKTQVLKIHQQILNTIQ